MPPESRRERKKEETRRKILDAAFSLFKKNGFNNTTVDKITYEADVGKGTFYNYFSTKEALLYELMDSIGQERGERIWPSILKLTDTRQRLAKVVRTFTDWFEEHPELARAYLQEKVIHDFKNPDGIQQNHLELYFLEILKLGQASGDIRDDIEPLQMVYYLDGMLLIELNFWYKNGALTGLYERVMRGIDFFLIGALSTDK